jgi:hemolysin activation/secretion protein
MFHTFTAGVDWKNFDENVQIGLGTPDAQGFSTPIRYLPFTAAYSATHLAGAQRWQYGATATWAVRGLVSREAQFEDKRFGGQGNFLTLKADLAHERPLPRGFALALDLDAQLASQPLIGNEQFVAGGPGTVRGYPEAVASGDQALRGSVELRSPPLAKLADVPWLASLQAHAFLDGAHLQVRRALPGQASVLRLLGAGVGLRGGTVAGPAGMKGSLLLELGWPLRDIPSQGASGLRAHASGMLEF